jgi:hypothetical protein
MIRQFQTGSYVEFDPDNDLRVPFDVAVAATREGGEDTEPARIVVLGVGASVVDGYLDAPVTVLRANRTIWLADPPRANADLLVNSVYWLVGHEQYIAAGPVHVEPIRLIGSGTLTFLKVLCLAVLPLAALGLGGMVLFARRR